MHLFIIFIIPLTYSIIPSFSGMRARTIKRTEINGKVNEAIEFKAKLEQEKKRPQLLKELENELKHLDEFQDISFSKLVDPCNNDRTLQHLQMINKEAGKQQIKEIEKLSRLAIGKRILNLELKKKKDEHNAKRQKKEEIELFFRQNRIKRFDYNALLEEKLSQSTLVVRAYENGKGFIESDRMYRDKYASALQECCFLEVVKEVNRIFYANYSGSTRNPSLTERLFALLWIPIVLFAGMALTLPFVSFPEEEIVLIGLLCVILIVLFYLSMRSYYQKPSQNNQMEQSISDVQGYFQQINRELAERGAGVEWRCSHDFMYLEAVFLTGFPR